MLRAKILNLETDEFRRTILSPESNPHKECIIGRHPNCDIVLDSPEVSRYHAKIVFQNGDYLLNDLNSTDGCRLNKQAVRLNEDYVLEEEDAIYIGTFLFLIEEIEVSSEEGKFNGYNLKFFTSSFASTLSCVRTIAEAPDIKTFSFILEPAVFFPYKPGQFLPVCIEAGDRSVSCLCPISSSPTRPLLEVTFHRSSAFDSSKGELELVSDYFFEQIDVGAELKSFSKPQGLFTCFPDPPQKILFISSEFGIVPIISMLRWIYDTAIPCDITLIHSIHTPQNMPFKEELGFMSTYLPNFRIMITATQPQSSHPLLGWNGEITLDLLATIVPDLNERVTYLCGSGDFVQTVKGILHQLNFPMENCYEEIF
ncbi:FHA domain-containing protein [Phormidium tenue FACHB-886]|nr:FHA domain-containing protein [Phormidium tenue FACHB-886]